MHLMIKFPINLFIGNQNKIFQTIILDIYAKGL